MSESQFQDSVKAEIESRLPEAIVLRGINNIQGFPDFLILFGKRFAVLEAKVSRKAKRQPNQKYWIEHFGKANFSSFIYPENRSEVLDAMEHALRK